MQFLEQIPLAPLTTFGIGGSARWFAEAASEDDVVAAVEFARARALPMFVLGGGSNLLVADSGYAGLVLRIALKGIREVEGDGMVRFEAAAGEEWDALVSRTVEQNCGGMECLAGIPGSVGGTPVQNVGAYGQEVSQTIVGVRCYDLELKCFVEFSNHECGFAYRTSRFNTKDRNRFIVTNVTFELTSGSPASIFYADLKQYFKDCASSPSLDQVASAVRTIRRDKGMLITSGDPDCRSAGSFFKNPVVPQELFDRIAASSATAVPQYPAGDGQVKIPAAWLLDQAGFHKGYQKGRAGISSRHTLALINRGEASAGEILALRDEIVACVFEKFEIRLEPEPVWLG